MKTITFTITISDDNQVKVTGLRETTTDKPKRKYKKRRGSKRVSKTEVMYKDMWGREWPIYVTDKGKEFILRKKHKGSNKYKHYIK